MIVFDFPSLNDILNYLLCLLSHCSPSNIFNMYFGQKKKSHMLTQMCKNLRNFLSCLHVSPLMVEKLDFAN